MTAYIALLRAANVGGTGKLPMPALVKMCEACGDGNRDLTAKSAAAQNTGPQNTMLMAATGVTVAVVLRPAEAIRAPAITPILAFQLYSIAGAR